jgi:putative oxidoreductase
VEERNLVAINLMKRFFSPLPLWQDNGLALIRIVTGGFLIYHGCEMFDTPAMNEYFKWDMFKDSSNARIFVYSGKAAEFVSGILLVLGLFTRIACIIVICTLGYIAFFVGHGKIWYEDQYPFLFVVIGFIFIFTGPGAFSLDNVILKNKSD